MLLALPKAWEQLIADDDDLLLEIVADRVETICSFKPEPDMVARFLKKDMASRTVLPVSQRAVGQTLQRQTAPPPVLITQVAVQPPAAQPRAQLSYGQIGFSFEGQFHPSRNAIDTLRQVFELLIDRDPTFCDRFAGLPQHGRSRRYLARDSNELYPGRRDLVQEHSLQLTKGWWMSTNHSKQTIGKIIDMACDVAQIVNGKNLVAHLGD